MASDDCCKKEHTALLLARDVPAVTGQVVGADAAAALPPGVARDPIDGHLRKATPVPTAAKVSFALGPFMLFFFVALGFWMGVFHSNNFWAWVSAYAVLAVLELYWLSASPFIDPDYFGYDVAARGGQLVVSHTRLFGVHPTNAAVPLAAIAAVKVVNKRALAVERNDGGADVFIGRRHDSDRRTRSGCCGSKSPLPPLMGAEAALWAGMASAAAGGRDVPVVDDFDSAQWWGCKFVW